MPENLTNTAGAGQVTAARIDVISARTVPHSMHRDQRGACLALNVLIHIEEIKAQLG
jgi:hypothetical protein